LGNPEGYRVSNVMMGYSLPHPRLALVVAAVLATMLPRAVSARGVPIQYKVADQRSGQPGCEGMAKHTPVSIEAIKGESPYIVKSVLDWYVRSEYRRCGRGISCRVFASIDGIPASKRMTVMVGTAPKSTPKTSKNERIFQLTVEEATDLKGAVISVEQGRYLRGALRFDQIDLFQVLRGPDAYLACLRTRVIS